ncbi:MAG: hypothetical protein Tsb0021_13100 [Chlamydiales bacterium]
MISNKVLNACTTIKFDVIGNSYVKNVLEARGFVEGLQETQDKTSLVFSEVVANYSAVIESAEGLNHNVATWYGKGPFTSQQFLKLLQFEDKISIEDWTKHMQQKLLQFEDEISNKDRTKHM